MLLPVCWNVCGSIGCKGDKRAHHYGNHWHWRRNGCDGQVLVCNDLLGVSNGFCPKFVKKYANLHDTTVEAVKAYITDVKARNFPHRSIHLKLMKQF